MLELSRSSLACFTVFHYPFMRQKKKKKKKLEKIKSGKGIYKGIY